MNSHSKTDIDNFVDKLENLMAARSRQYQERVKMDKELAERRKKALESRQRQEEQSISGNSSEKSDAFNLEEEKRSMRLIIEMDAERMESSPSDDLGHTSTSMTRDETIKSSTDEQISPRDVEALCFEVEDDNSSEAHGRNETEIVHSEHIVC